MKNELTIFENAEFGNLTVINKDGAPWFVGKEIAVALGYKNTNDAIISICKGVAKYDLPHPQSKTAFIKKNIIPESDLYRLIMRSKLPAAEKFQDWVVEEVLPTIRQTGSYSVEQPEVKPELPHWAIEGNGVAHFFQKYNAPAHMIAIAEAKHIHQIGGPDFRETINQLPCSQNIQDDEVYLEPTELGKLFKLSAIKMNKLLEKIGFQVKENKIWKPTQKGIPFCTKHSWSKGNKSGYNYKWNVSKITELI